MDVGLYLLSVRTHHDLRPASFTFPTLRIMESAAIPVLLDDFEVLPVTQEDPDKQVAEHSSPQVLPERLHFLPSPLVTPDVKGVELSVPKGGGGG